MKPPWLRKNGVALTCQTPMIAFIIRITRITNGSTNAVVLSSPSSNNASTWTIENQAWQIKNLADVADQWIADVYVQLINLL